MAHQCSFARRFQTVLVFRSKWVEHDVEIVKVRPQMLGGLRSASYTVSVDDTVVADVRGS